MYTGMDISTKNIVCTTLNENGSIVRKADVENSFEKLGKYLDNFSPGDRFVMGSTGFYGPLYDFLESRGFDLILANPLKIKLIAEFRMKFRGCTCSASRRQIGTPGNAISSSSISCFQPG